MADPSSFGVTSFTEYCYTFMASELGVISPTSKHNYYEGFVNFTERMREHIQYLKSEDKLSSLESEIELIIFANGEEKTILFDGKGDLFNYLEIHKKINLILNMCGCKDSVDEASLNISNDAIYDYISRKINEDDTIFSMMEFIFDSEDKNKKDHENVARNRIVHAKNFFLLSEDRVRKLEKITNIKI